MSPPADITCVDPLTDAADAPNAEVPKSNADHRTTVLVLPVVNHVHAVSSIGYIASIRQESRADP